MLWRKQQPNDHNSGVKYVLNGHVVHRGDRGYNNHMKLSTTHQTRAMRYNAAARAATDAAKAGQYRKRAAEERQHAREAQRLAALILAERLTKPKRKPSTKYEYY